MTNHESQQHFLAQHSRLWCWVQNIFFIGIIAGKVQRGRVMDGDEEIDLELKKGTNGLLFVLTSDECKQNWGMIARISSHKDILP
jgi:hypothetical protein